MIAAVVVTYSAPPGVLDGCLRSLAVAGGLDRVVVVDTGGRADLADHDVELVRSANRGYGAAANLGFAAAISAGADRIALLNDDVVVRAGWLAPLAAELTDRVGAAQPMVLDGGGAGIGSLGVRIGADGAGVDVGRGEAVPVDGPAADIELFTGGAVLFDVAFLRATGGFDERFFLYYEDVDLARRGSALGWRFRVVPGAVVEHVGGVSTSALPDRTRYLQERNRLWSAFRHEPPGTVVRALWLSVRRLRFAPRPVHARALAAGLAGAPRRISERARGREVARGTPLSA